MGVPDDEEVRRELAALPARPAAERAGYLMALGWSRPGRPTPGLEPFLDDPEPLVRVAAAQARWQTAGDAGDLDRLVGILVEALVGSDEELALVAGTALVNMEEAAVAPLVRRFAERGEKDALIVRVLGEIAGDEAEGCLRQAAGSSRADVAAEAREALAAIAEEDL